MSNRPSAAPIEAGNAKVTTRAVAAPFTADTLFKGETLRSILLNAYGWWTVSTIAVFAGYAMVIAGWLLGLLAFLGFRHAKRV